MPAHMPLADPPLLDVTRLVALRWTGRRANGIDRVALAYLSHFAPVARAVVQHRGVVRVFGRRASGRLFALLAGGGTRPTLAALLTAALADPRAPGAGAIYLNVAHTDFDLAAHHRWVARHGLHAVYLLHDLIPLTHPHFCRPHAVARHRGRVLGALASAAGIVTGSAAVADDLARFAAAHGSDVPPLLVAPLDGAALRREVTPAPGDYFLCVGTIEPRKNHALLAEVWRRLAARLGQATPRLVVVGAWGHASEAIRAAFAADDLAGLVEVAGPCDDDRLAALMLGARALLMPTLAEGFGLPMAEALALGVPVIASELPVFKEVGAGVPHLLDPTDADAWVARLAAFDAPTARRHRHLQALHGWRAPTWDAHFARLDPWLAALATPRGVAARLAGWLPATRLPA